MRTSHPRTSLLLALAGVGALLWASCTQVASPSPAAAAPKANIPWDWTGIIGTGQSLAVGQNAANIASTTQPYRNMKLDTDTLQWPIDANAPELKLVPLVEPIERRSMAYPSSWPTNIAGETPHSSMANELTALVEQEFNRDFISIHGEVGENGQGIQFLKKNPTQRGVNGHAYEASMVEVKAITRLAKAAGKTYGVGAITIVHGENDAGNNQYEGQLHQLWQDYNTDIPAITGQTQKILMIVSQQNSTNDRSASTIAQWKIGVDDPEDFVCSGPKYQYPSGDALHTITEGYRELGEKFAQIYFQRVILGRQWLPLEPTGVTRNGKVFTVQFHVPVGPLVWDTQMSVPHAGIAEWKNGKGFEVLDAQARRVGIDSVEISGDAVVIACSTDPGAGSHVSYALYRDPQPRTQPTRGFRLWGLLRDSDPFKGAITGKEQPNYAVAFELIAP